MKNRFKWHWKSQAPGSDDFFEVTESLDLSWIANEWEEIGGDQKLAKMVHFGQWSHRLSKKVQRSLLQYSPDF